MVQEIARRVGRKKYENFLKKTGFGNQQIGEKVDMFWIDGSLRVTPGQQINFLVDLYEEDLPFSKKSMKKVKEIMIADSTNDYILRAKTGWGYMDRMNIGWWVGYIEIKSNVYFFATRILLPLSENDDGFGTCRKTITLEVLKRSGIIK